MAKLILKIIFKTLKVILTVFVIIALIVIISQRVTNNKLRLYGYGVYTVISESMLPEYEVGDMFLAKEIDEGDIKVGDDIVYIGEVDSYKDKVITHRVIRIEPDKTIVTKGINNDLEDPPIQYKQVYGKVTSKFVVLSLFSKLMNNNVLFYILIFVPFTLLIFFDTKDLFGDKKKNKNKKEEKEPENTTPTAPPVAETTAPTIPQVVETTVPIEPVKVDNNVQVNNTVIENKEVKEETVENKE